MIGKTYRYYILMILVSVMSYAQKNMEESIDKNLLMDTCVGCELVELSLNGLINEVVKRNYELYSEKSKVRVSEHKIGREEGIFEPNFQASTGVSRTNVPNSAEQTLSRGFQDNYRDRVRSFESSISGLMSTGGEWKVGFSDNKKRSNLISETQDYDVEYSDGFSLSLKQPLLRGMGTDVTYAKINMAKLGNKINKTEYKNKLMGLVATTIHLYWRLYGTQKLYESWKKTLIISENQLKNIQALAKYGKIPQTEVLEAGSSILHKKTELMTLKTTINEIKNQLLSLLNVSSLSFQSSLFLVKDRPGIRKKQEVFNVDKSYEKAIKNLPELQLAELKLASKKLEQKYNENQLLPDLSLNGMVSTLGLSNNKNNSLYCSGGGCNDQVSWNVSLNVEVPLYGNKRAKESLAISNINLRDSELAIESFQKEIYNVITTKVEQLQIEKFKLEQYQKEAEMKSKLLDIERQKMRLGKSRMRNILEYEDRLMSTERKWLSSVVNWKVAEALLLKATGDLLAHQNIELDFSEEVSSNVGQLSSMLLEQ
ncbi:MAG TPA: TolC family protein [Campylobacterales bacterium]|nr:TolC family protein [Campylobacterales bacterium]